MKKIKIVFLEHCTDNTVGGSHYCLLEICRTLDKTRYDATIVFYQKNDLYDEFVATGHKVRIEQAFEPVAISQSVPGIIRKVMRPPMNYLKMLVWRAFKWRALLKQEGADVLHLNNTFSTDHDAIIAAKMLGVKVVSHVRGIEKHLSRMALIMSRRIDRVIAISNAVKNNLLNKGVAVDNMRLVYDGINEQRIVSGVQSGYLHNTYDLDGQRVVFGLVGNIKAWKGQRVLVEAVHLLKQKYNDFYCFFVGAVADPQYQAELETYVSQHGLDQHVIFTGYQKNIPDIVNSFDIFVHASIEPEPFGIVILEAMALRKPVIVSNIGAPQEIIVDKVSGRLFDITNPQDLADRLFELIEDAAGRKAMGEAGYQRFIEHFTIDRNVAGITDVYDEILDK
ncbi:MAG: glycosyltransferase family 4 protein [Candidatus Thiodiazotropha sp.]